MAKPLLAITEVVSCSWPPGLYTSLEGIYPTPLFISSPRFRGWRLATQTFSPLHRFSMGLRSVDWLQTLQNFNVLVLEPLLCCLGRVFWVIVKLEHASWTMLYHDGPVHRPFDAAQLFFPLSRTPPQKSIMFPLPCSTVVMVFLWP